MKAAWTKLVRPPALARAREWVPGHALIRSQAVVGLDIGAYSVKAVQSVGRPGQPGGRILQYGYQTVPGAGGRDDEDAAAEALQELWKTARFSSRRVKAAISDPKVYLRHIHIPQVNEQELASAIRWQAEKHVPFSIDDAVVDFQILPVSRNQDQGQMEIILVAVEKTVVDRYLNIFKKARLHPLVLDLAPFAVTKAVLAGTRVADDELLPVIDIGERTTNLLFLESGGIVLVRNLDYAGQHIVQEVSRELNLPKSESRALLEGSGLYAAEGQGRTSYALEPAVLELLEQMTRSFAYCEREFLDRQIRRAFLCGGGSCYHGLAEILSKHLNLIIEAVDPLTFWKDVRIPEWCADGKHRPCLAAACGEVL